MTGRLEAAARLVFQRACCRVARLSRRVGGVPRALVIPFRVAGTVALVSRVPVRMADVLSRTQRRALTAVSHTGSCPGPNKGYYCQLLAAVG